VCRGGGAAVHLLHYSKTRMLALHEGSDVFRSPGFLI
jgi:hypothetical protein